MKVKIVVFQKDNKNSKFSSNVGTELCTHAIITFHDFLRKNRNFRTQKLGNLRFSF
jgi:hypothetical protein